VGSAHQTFHKGDARCHTRRLGRADPPAALAPLLPCLGEVLRFCSLVNRILALGRDIVIEYLISQLKLRIYLVWLYL
jgi:hypothetical protein